MEEVDILDSVDNLEHLSLPILVHKIDDDGLYTSSLAIFMTLRVSNSS